MANLNKEDDQWKINGVNLPFKNNFWEKWFLHGCEEMVLENHKLEKCRKNDLKMKNGQNAV